MRRKIPSLQALTCFDAAARHQSYSRAAQELSLTQGAVSRQIAGLEQMLGLELFTRTRHGVRLTERGADYARQVAPRLQALEQDTLDAMAAQGRGSTLHLAAVPTFATRWLIPRLPSLRALHPQLVLHLETRTRPFMFAETPFEAALWAGTPEQIQAWAGTRAQHLLDEDVVAVCAPSLLPRGQPLFARELAELPLLQQSTRPLAWRTWFEAQGVQASQPLAGPRLELFSMTAAAAACGLGVALVPRLLITDELASGALVLACEAQLPPEGAYYLITPEREPDGVALQWLRAWLGGL